MKNGLKIVNNFLTKEECNQIINVIDRCIESNNISQVVDGDFRIYGIENFLDNQKLKQKLNLTIPYVEDYASSKLFEHFYLGAKLTPSSSKGSGGGWHKDSILKKQVKCIIYLNDVDSSNGPFQYVEGSNQFFKNIFHILRYGFTTRFPKGNFKFKEVCGSAGTLIISDTNGIHRGSPIVEKERYAITLYSYFEPAPKSVKELVLSN